MDKAQSEEKLAAALCVLCGAPEGSSVDDAEKYIEKICTEEGFNFLGERTMGAYGPYIWSETERKIYDIELPDGMCTLPVNMMDGFISRSWLEFISFGNIGTGGWVSGMKQELFCVRKSYKKYFDKPRFLLSYLKHEAQHAHDREMFGEMAPIDLEYRAKLVELIYWPTTKRFMDFVYESDSRSRDNSHSLASYNIVSEISRRVFGMDMQNEKEALKGKNKKIKHAALDMLNENSEKVKAFREKTSDMITVL